MWLPRSDWFGEHDNGLGVCFKIKLSYTVDQRQKIFVSLHHDSKQKYGSYLFFFTDFRHLKACFQNLFFDVVQNKVENSFRHVFQDLISRISIKAGDLARNVTGSANPGFLPSVCNKICATFKTLRIIVNVITASLRCCIRHELNGSFESK